MHPKSNIALLEILVPTYNRPVELSECLQSIVRSIDDCNLDLQDKLTVRVRDNSTKYLDNYKRIYSEFEKLFNARKVDFNFERSGFNIGGYQNIIGGISVSNCMYIWVLPDDDLARFDSISSIISTIDMFSPSLIVGGCEVKSYFTYGSKDIQNEDGAVNSVLDVTKDNQRVPLFLRDNVVQLQEYVFKVSALKKYIFNEEHIVYFNDMFPGFFAIMCLNEDGSFVRLKRSVGIFRDGDPSSEWRHLWYHFIFVMWPTLCAHCMGTRLLSAKEYRLAVLVFKSEFKRLLMRPDILLCVNSRYKLNMLFLIQVFGVDYLKFMMLSLLFSPVSMLRYIVRSVRRRIGV